MATEAESLAYWSFLRAFSVDKSVQQKALTDFSDLLREHIKVPYALRAIDGYLVLTIYHGEQDDRVHMGIPELLKRYLGIIQVVDPETRNIVQVVYKKDEDLYEGRGIWPDAATWDSSIGLGERKTQWGHLLTDD